MSSCNDVAFNVLAKKLWVTLIVSRLINLVNWIWIQQMVQFVLKNLMFKTVFHSRDTFPSSVEILKKLRNKRGWGKREMHHHLWKISKYIFALYMQEMIMGGVGNGIRFPTFNGNNKYSGQEEPVGSLWPSESPIN